MPTLRYWTLKYQVRCYSRRHGLSRRLPPSHLRVTAHSPTLWEVTFDNPPVNVIGPDMMRDLKDLLTELGDATTPSTSVRVRQRRPRFLPRPLRPRPDPESPRRCRARPATPPGSTSQCASASCPPSPSARPGIARGAGSEFALATDIGSPAGRRRCSARWRWGSARCPAVARPAGYPPWSDVAGRSRSCWAETISTATPPSGTATSTARFPTPSSGLRRRLRTRVAGWDHRALGEIKSFINKYTRLPDAEYPLHSDAFWGAARTDGFQSVATALFDEGTAAEVAIGVHPGTETPTLPTPRSGLYFCRVPPPNITKGDQHDRLMALRMATASFYKEPAPDTVTTDTVPNAFGTPSPADSKVHPAPSPRNSRGRARRLLQPRARQHRPTRRGAGRVDRHHRATDHGPRRARLLRRRDPPLVS